MSKHQSKSLISRSFFVFVFFIGFFQKSFSAENLFFNKGPIIFNKEKGFVFITGVHVLQDSAYIVADTVVIKGTLVTLNHDLTIIARKVVFSKRPEGIVLRPFELLDSQSPKTLVDSLILENQKSDTHLKFPLSHVIPHIVSVPGLKTKKARDFELNLIPGKVTIISGRILGKPVISNQRDFFAKDIKNLELHSAAVSSNPTQNLPLSSKVDIFSNVKIYHGSNESINKTNIFDPVKISTSQFTSDEKKTSLDYLKNKFGIGFEKIFNDDYNIKSNLLLSEEIDPFFFFVSLGVDHYIALAKGDKRFTPKNNLNVLLENYESILKDVSTIILNISSLSLIEKDEVKVIVGDRVVPLNVYHREKLNNLLRKLFEKILHSEDLIKDVIENIDPVYIPDALKVFRPDNIQLEALDKVLKEYPYSLPDYIPLDKGNWVCNIPEIPLDQWKRIF